MKLTQARRTYAAKHVAAMAHFKPRPRDWGSNRVPAGEFCKVTIQCGRWRHNAALAKPTMLPTPDVLVLLSQKARADFGRVEALPSRSGRGRACAGSLLCALTFGVAGKARRRRRCVTQRDRNPL